MEDLLKKATGGLEGVALDIVNASSGILKKKLTEAFAIERLKIFRENIERIGFVKTILNPDSIKNWMISTSVKQLLMTVAILTFFLSLGAHMYLSRVGQAKGNLCSCVSFV